MTLEERKDYILRIYGLARRAGVEKATIDECLCHIGYFPVADIYIERDWELLNAANRRTIALLRWA